jgi:hypothetical protein
MDAHPPNEHRIAPLQSINLNLLLKGDGKEHNQLLHLCETTGFFYLDLRESTGFERHLNDWNDILRFMEEYFAQQLDSKLQDFHNNDAIGYVSMAA